MASTANYIPGVSLADKLRLAASKGQLDKVKELVVAGATFVPDRVSLNLHGPLQVTSRGEGCSI